MTLTVMELMDALRTHLNEFTVPAPRSVNITTYLDQRNVSVQISPEHQDVGAGLLVWAGTLARVTAEAWRMDDDDWVHLSVTGESPSGVVLHVYGYQPFNANTIGIELAPGARATISLTALRRMTR